MNQWTPTSPTQKGNVSIPPDDLPLSYWLTIHSVVQVKNLTVISHLFSSSLKYILYLPCFNSSLDSPESWHFAVWKPQSNQVTSLFNFFQSLSTVLRTSSDSMSPKCPGLPFLAFHYTLPSCLLSAAGLAQFTLTVGKFYLFFFFLSFDWLSLAAENQLKYPRLESASLDNQPEMSCPWLFSALTS